MFRHPIALWASGPVYACAAVAIEFRELPPYKQVWMQRTASEIIAASVFLPPVGWAFFVTSAAGAVSSGLGKK